MTFSRVNLPAGCVDAGLRNPDEVLRSKLLLWRLKFILSQQRKFRKNWFSKIKANHQKKCKSDQKPKHLKTFHILKTPPGIELRLVLLPRRLALIETPPELPPPSRSLSTLRCVDGSSDPNKLSARSRKCRLNPQYALKSMFLVKTGSTAP